MLCFFLANVKAKHLPTCKCLFSRERLDCDQIQIKSSRVKRSEEKSLTSAFCV